MWLISRYLFCILLYYWIKLSVLLVFLKVGSLEFYIHSFKSFSHGYVCLLKSHICSLTGRILDTDGWATCLTWENCRGEVFICWHVDNPAVSSATAQLPSSMWTRTGGSHPFSMDITVFSNSQLFISSLMGSLKNISLNNCARISVAQPLTMSTARWKHAPLELWWVLYTVLPEGPFTLLSRGSTGASASSLYHQGHLPPDQKPASLTVMALCHQRGQCVCSRRGGQASVTCRGSAHIMCMCLPSLENTVLGEFSAPQGC